MSLLRQLWVSVVVAMAVVLSGAFGISLITARNYFEQQLLAQANDGAVSLALSMSQQSKDRATLELLVAALFDGGHFRSIRLTDPAGQVIVERNQPDTAEGVPAWLPDLLPMEARPGQALVSDGWHQLGQVTVTAARGYAYRALWKGCLQLGSLMLAIGLFWAVAVSALLRWVRRPLQDMAEQAEAVGAGHFRILAEPRVIELRSMARALNHMSERVQSLFAEQAGRIESLRDEATHDPVTGLFNRASFFGELRRALSDVTAPPSGTIGLLRVDDLGRVNKTLGRARTDEWLAALAEALRTSQDGLEEILLARIGGADFAFLHPGGDSDAAQQTLERARAAVKALDLRLESDEEPMRLVGAATVYRQAEAITDLMARLDLCLMQAESGDSPAHATVGDLPVPGQEGWRGALEHALAERRFALAEYPLLANDGRLIHREFMLRLTTAEGSVMSAGHFMPAAVRVGLAAACDLEALRLALLRLPEGADPVAVNVAPRSLTEPGFLDRLDVLLAGAGSAASRVAVEVSERGLDARLAGLEALADVLARHGAALGIEHFGRQLAALPRLYALRLSYLKLDGSFVAGLPDNEANQRLVKAIVDVAHGLHVAVYAEQVYSAEEWAAAAALGVVGMTGPEASRRAGR
ncbi:MAG TPA: LapD/MoxY N-terminal periplasmic domain-containing protein [Zoogloea sp.]|uniref:bifunctional diguanylate cyclase/phosphodiesterase n=1 Tax=Zoogloea sp. TaxID=49181 RepID=UPI002B661C5E|nr:LapD/MoxY N-terminal periplasmic domain-containing protein [Zoogloea sp.]HMV17163.1 LapD/MoxY N-terminal periplasmic domain-containing protein [Rhodocyclaceae bacterium]HMV64266.1 LapD/MoxY N-terminal periplasmic domain-containing protein [Rhodocyclaceae bacterium]HNA66526.1 LapD/MoxY N-terminal periplasmic domain-containing protein [Rhodocyclaceae bacterium]HNB65811.1 LapD/MoxY N-terminal periplasmic domain-containing protein [Rhodocyclaceae bacterium]HNC79571.1 LapD/MoxY N-terminal peripl